MSKISFLPYNHFREERIRENKDSNNLNEIFQQYFQKVSATVTYTGRQAISVLLNSLRLKKSDEIYIVTTFDFPNVSSCVTSTIFNYCKPSRVLSKNTRAIFVIHEFGVPYSDINSVISECRRRDIPLIEDCAHTINSEYLGQRVGTFGDWVICSLPKIFPVPYGGVLIGQPVHFWPSTRQRIMIESLIDTVHNYFTELNHISNRRREVFDSLSNIVERFNLKPLFDVTKEITPWFFPLEVPSTEEMIEAAYEEEIDCALWYGTNIVVFPCHQYITTDQIEKIGKTIRIGLERA